MLAHISRHIVNNSHRASSVPPRRPFGFFVHPLWRAERRGVEWVQGVRNCQVWSRKIIAGQVKPGSVAFVRPRPRGHPKGSRSCRHRPPLSATFLASSAAPSGQSKPKSYRQPAHDERTTALEKKKPSNWTSRDEARLRPSSEQRRKGSAGTARLPSLGPSHHCTRPGPPCREAASKAILIQLQRTNCANVSRVGNRRHLAA